MCNPRCISCDRIIDSEDSGEIAYCEDCFNELIKEAEERAYVRGYVVGYKYGQENIMKIAGVI